MSRRLFLVTVDGVGRSKPTAVRAKAVRARCWWSRRCPGLDVAIRRVRPAP